MARSDQTTDSSNLTLVEMLKPLPKIDWESESDNEKVFVWLKEK